MARPLPSSTRQRAASRAATCCGQLHARNALPLLRSNASGAAGYHTKRPASLASAGGLSPVGD